MKIKWLLLNSFTGDCVLAILNLLIADFEVFLFSLKLSIVDLFELVSLWRSIHIMYFQIRVLAAQTYIYSELS